MSEIRYISIETLCSECEVDAALIREFADFGLIHLHIIQEREHIVPEDVDHLERLVWLYKDLGVNKEGIEVILSMRQQLINVQKELDYVKTRMEHLEQEKHFRYVELPKSFGLIVDIDKL